VNMMEEIEALRHAPVPELVARYQEVWGKPPRVKHREWLWKKIAWKIQERRYGGLSGVAKRRLEELIAEIDLPLREARRTVSGALKAPTAATELPVGAVLVRPWRGQEIRVTAVDGGFEWDGAVYRSLSAVAQAITGSKWNGRLFFGLTKRNSVK
jgi:hypothetical protein